MPLLPSVSSLLPEALIRWNRIYSCWKQALVVLELFLLSISMTRGVWGGDWPQILGPNRNGIAEDEKLAPRWPRGGPPTLWERPIGSGYAGAAIVGERVYIFHRVGDEEILECLRLSDGTSLFRDASPTSFTPQVGEENGPLCVPVVHQDRVITYGAQGLLTCVNAINGTRLWQRKTHLDFKAPEGYFGAGSTPIVVGDHVIVNVGGAKTSAGIVAFSLKTGETVWQQTNEPASYSAPVRADINDIPLVMMVSRYRCQLLDPQAGTILFQFPFGQRGPTVNGACPLILGDRLLVTSSYGIGAVYGQFDLLGFEPIYEGERPIATQYCTPIHQDGFLYFIDGRDDVPPADLKCVELALLKSKSRPDGSPSTDGSRLTSPVRWIEHNFGYGTLLLADGKLIILKTTGELLMIQPTPESFKVISKCRPLTGVARALPALSNGKLVIRNQNTLKCLALGRGI